MNSSWLHSTGYGQTKTVLLTRYWKIGTRLWLNRNFLIIFVKSFVCRKHNSAVLVYRDPFIFCIDILSLQSVSIIPILFE